MSVNSIDSTNQTSGLSSLAANGSASLGEEDFLTLLVAQLEHQDPLDPQDNSAFIAQLAEFSALEQQTTTNKNLEDLINSSQAVEQLSAFSLLGQTVVGEQSNFTLGEEPVEIGFDLKAPTDMVSIAILDKSNSVVNTLELENQTTGTNFFSWDGTDTNGNSLPQGDYTIMATALFSDETSQPLSTLQRAQVTGIDTGDETLLETNQGYMKLNQLQSVSSL